MEELIGDLGHEMVGFQAVVASIDEVVDEKPGLLIIDLRVEDRPQEVSGWELSSWPARIVSCARFR